MYIERWRYKHDRPNGRHATTGIADIREYGK